MGQSDDRAGGMDRLVATANGMIDRAKAYEAADRVLRAQPAMTPIPTTATRIVDAVLALPDPECEELRARYDRLAAIIDRPDPHDFLVASLQEARYQMQLWGDGDGFPTAFSGTDDASFVYLIGYLAGKVAANREGLEKKLHRITTIAAAAANWHIVTIRSGRERTAVDPEVIPIAEYETKLREIVAVAETQTHQKFVDYVKGLLDG